MNLSEKRAMDCSKSILRYEKGIAVSSTPSMENTRSMCHNMKPDETLQDDDTELLSSFASMMLSSVDTLNELSWNNSSLSILQKSLITKSQQDESSSKELLYKLTKNEHDCFGYLQFQVIVTFKHEVPTELSVVSGKLVLYIQTVWSSCDSNSLIDAFVHPLLVEAIESLFIPVAVIPDYPTTTDDETSYQLQIVSIGFMDATHQDLVTPIVGQHLSQLPILVKTMLCVMNMNEQTIPIYLLDLAESCCRDTETVFERCAWFCFHDIFPSESEFKALDGVYRTRIGSIVHRDEYPIVEVIYNYKETSYGSLVERILTRLTSKQVVVYCQSNDERMAARVQISKLSKLGTYHRQVAVVQINKNIIFEPATEDSSWEAIRQTPLRYAPMTDYQATKANQLISSGQIDKAAQLLSPRQTNFVLTAISNGFIDFYDVLGHPILDAWLTAVDKKPPKRRSISSHQRIEACSNDADVELYAI